MRVLVTGGAGFIGYNIALEMKSRGHDIVILDNIKDGRNELNWMMAKDDGIEKIHASVNSLISWSGPSFNLPFPELRYDFDAIIHCAAQTAVTHSLRDPITDFLTNAEGTFAVCEFARQNDAKILFTSTNKVYGDNVNKVTLKEIPTRYEHHGGWTVDEMFPIDQTHHTPYGTSKLAADLYVQDYHHTYGLDTVVFRMSCIYGRGQIGSEDQGWISHMVQQWVNNRRINIFGNGKQVRDVLYIDDLCEVMARAVERDDFSGVFNIGGGPKNTISVLELFEMLDDWMKVKYDRNNLYWYPWRPADQRVYISNISKAKRILGFYPEVSPQNGIRQLYNGAVVMRDSVRLK